MLKQKDGREQSDLPDDSAADPRQFGKRARR